jgi:hypothetical protein
LTENGCNYYLYLNYFNTQKAVILNGFFEFKNKKINPKELKERQKERYLFILHCKFNATLNA